MVFETGFSMGKNCKSFGTPLPQETPGEAFQMEEVSSSWQKNIKFVNLVEKLCKICHNGVPLNCNGGMTNK